MTRPHPRAHAGRIRVLSEQHGYASAPSGTGAARAGPDHGGVAGEGGTLGLSDEAVLRTFMRNGRITALPAKRSRRLVLLDHIAQLFDVGVRYSEGEVNRILLGLHEDYAALRRYLVDEGFLSRDHGEYWRTGGSVDL